MLFFLSTIKFNRCITTYFLQAYNDSSKHANAVHSISLYIPTPSKHPLSYRLLTNEAKTYPIYVPTNFSATKKILEYSIFTRDSKQFIEMPYFTAIMANECLNISMKTHRSRLRSSLCLFVPIYTRNTEYNKHVVSDLIAKPVRKKENS